MTINIVRYPQNRLMTTWKRKLWQVCSRRIFTQKPSINLTTKGSYGKTVSKLTYIISGTAAFSAGFEIKKLLRFDVTETAHEMNENPVKLTALEERFIKFSTVEYKDRLYMTPKNFLESMVEAEPRPIRKRRILTDAEIEAMKKHTPPLNERKSKLFRSLEDNAIISYTDYLFLLSVLMKPQSGFRIYFDLIDTDANHEVDKEEFSVMEKIFSHAWRRRGLTPDGMKIAEGLDKNQGNVDTFLNTYFFGPKGNNKLDYDHFKQFMMNLQTEVLELEFNDFSMGTPTISEVDFAEILLRYTHLNLDEHHRYLYRLLYRIEETKGISFDEFQAFFLFLKNLEDFSVAVKMYTLADLPISEEEFHRAVKVCTGTTLSQHLVHTVFTILDDDGDGKLSYGEFIAIMKDRLHRGFKPLPKKRGFKAFAKCVTRERKT